MLWFDALILLDFFLKATLSFSGVWSSLDGKLFSSTAIWKFGTLRNADNDKIFILRHIFMGKQVLYFESPLLKGFYMSPVQDNKRSTRTYLPSHKRPH